MQAMNSVKSGNSTRKVQVTTSRETYLWTLELAAEAWTDTRQTGQERSQLLTWGSE